MKICLNCGVVTERNTGICQRCTDELEEKRQATLELHLLNYWKSNGVKWLYKYKHRLKEYRGENKATLELFADLTSGKMFSDVVDIANSIDATGDEVKIDIDTLIEERQHTRSINNEIKSGDFVTRIDGQKHLGSESMVHRIGDPEAFFPYGGVQKVFRHSTKEEIEAERMKVTMDSNWTDPNIMSEHFINFIIKENPFNFNAFKNAEEYERYVAEVNEFCKRGEKK